MFTVLIKYKATGRDVLFSQVRSVEFEHPAPGENAVSAGLLLNFVGNEGSHYPPSEREEDYREVFVMNDAGQTVARYTL